MFDLINQEGNKIDLDELAKDQDAEIRRARKATRIRPKKK